MLSWAPNIITFIIMLGVGGKTLASVPMSAAVPATAASLITFGSALAVTILAWCPIVPDYGIFHDAKGPRSVLVDDALTISGGVS